MKLIFSLTKCRLRQEAEAAMMRPNVQVPPEARRRMLRAIEHQLRRKARVFPPQNDASRNELPAN